MPSFAGVLSSLHSLNLTAYSPTCIALAVTLEYASYFVSVATHVVGSNLALLFV